MSETAIVFRQAREEDLPGILALLADDPLGKTPPPEGPLEPGILGAFQEIAADPNQYLLVAEVSDRLAAYLQITFIPGLTLRGAWRAHIEAVRVASEHRRQGVGRALFQRAFEIARDKDCAILQLMMDRRRTDAQVFYESLGFVSSHQGMRLSLSQTD